MRGLTLVLLLALCAAAMAADLQRLDFVLEYSGTFAPDAKDPSAFSGVFKGQSQSIVTRIAGNGTVSFDMGKLIGSVSVLSLDVTTTQNMLNTVSGNLTFGVHSTHNDHTLSFKNEASHILNDIGNGLVTTGCVLHVTKGEGVYKDAEGTITLNIVIDMSSGDALVFAVGIMWVDQN
ncbi:hypothetical protein QOT17_007714 [Balamuthia mandrillaris]